ncbi:MAG: hypothetical protein K0R62_7955 [Nonomuraea muscovyensis]|nr:hypothetical protein [Nonomuraea muscovyensis]
MDGMRDIVPPGAVARRLSVLVLMLPLLTACQNSPATAGRYSTGGDPSDDPCARVVSAIGYADLLLEPRGAEEAQNFESAAWVAWRRRGASRFSTAPPCPPPWIRPSGRWRPPPRGCRGRTCRVSAR